VSEVFWLPQTYLTISESPTEVFHNQLSGFPTVARRALSLRF
jgi:hypothetical protein